MRISDWSSDVCSSDLASVMATYVERLLAAGLLFVVALAGLWFLLRYISFDLALGGGYILFLGISAVLVSIAALWSLMGARFYGALKAGAVWFLRLRSCVALTVLIHGLTLAGYIVIIESMSPGSFT